MKVQHPWTGGAGRLEYTTAKTTGKFGKSSFDFIKDFFF